MKGQKNTKTAFLTSLTSLVVCFAMLLGTTFAWFTDTASTAVNTIQAGNLDVTLEYWDGSNWQNVTNTTKLFNDDARWEPGHTEVAYLRIANAGTLDLKYKLNVNVYAESGSTNVNGSAFKLSDYLVFGKIDMDSTANFYATDDAGRAAARAAAGTTTGLSAWTKYGTLLAESTTAAQEDILALVIYMPETVGNEANHAPGAAAPSIKMGVNVVATQLNNESDSFGSDYDLNADGTPDNGAAWTMAAFRAVADVPSEFSTQGMTITKYFNDDTAKAVIAQVTIPKQAELTAGDKVALSVVPAEVPTSVTNGLHNNQKAFNYEITLKKVAANNTETNIATATSPVTVELMVGTGLSGVKIFHTDATGTTEEVTGVTYNSDTGIASFSASSFSDYTVVYNTEATAVTLPENAKLVSTLAELEAAVGNLHDGDYIAFAANIVQDKVDTSSGQITFARASDAEGPVEATLNLNGYVFDGQIGGFWPADAVGLTVNVIGTEKVVADYYKHETGNHMVKACAVFNPEGKNKTVLKSGLFESTNAVIMAYGGEVVVDGGDLHNTKNGVVIYACNDPAITINGGNFSCKEGGAIFAIEPYRTTMGPVITINGGTFDASKGACFLSVDGGASDAGKIAQVIIKGGTFTMPTADGDLAQDGNGILASGSNRLVIQGGVFNVDPSAYVDTENYNVTNSGSTWTVTAK